MYLLSGEPWRRILVFCTSRGLAVLAIHCAGCDSPRRVYIRDLAREDRLLGCAGNTAQPGQLSGHH